MKKKEVMRDERYNAYIMTVLGENMFFTPQEIADRLKVTRRTVYLWIHEGQLTAVKVAPKAVRVSRTDLGEFLVDRIMKADTARQK